MCRLKVDKLRLEDSCREEINKWKIQLTESERLRSVVENRLQEETNRRADIAQRLHSVMETQWREALDIISNPMQVEFFISLNSVDILLLKLIITLYLFKFIHCDVVAFF